MKGATIVNNSLFFSTKDLRVRRFNLDRLLQRLIAGDPCLGFEGDRIFSEQAADFFVSPYDEAVYLLQPNGNVIRLNADQHIALSSIVQVTDWMSITKMGRELVVGGWSGERRENHLVLLNEHLEYLDRLDVKCHVLSRLR